MKNIAFTLLCLSQILNVYCQESKLPHSIETNVIELSTCSPEISSLTISKRNYSKHNMKMTINSGHLTAFKIRYINPLRYRYNVTNEFVTQFFEDKELPNSSTVNDTSDIKIGEIEVIHIFNANVQTKGGSWAKIAVLREELYKLDSIRNVLRRLEFIEMDIAKKRSDLENSDKIGDSTLGRQLDSIKAKIIETGLAYIDKQQKVNQISREQYTIGFGDKNFFWESFHVDCKPSNKNMNDSATEATKEMILKLVKETQYKLEANKIKDEENTDSLLRKIELRLQSSDEFIIATALEIGKLMQNKVIEYSRFYNKILNETCLKDRLAEIKSKRDGADDVFNFIQNISANLNIYINYYQLSHPTFDNIITQINSNYKTLLKFIKLLDHLEENNTKVFTFPSANNYKNVDFIRYTVHKVDKLTGRSEQYPYELWIKNGFKIDFSVAILASGILKDVFNKMPYYKLSDDGMQEVAAVDSFSLVRQRQGKFNFAFGGMVNLLWRTGASWITPGFSVGVAYGTNNQNLQFLSSISLQMGKSERLILHFGVAAGLAERLDLSQYSIFAEGANSYHVRGDFKTSQISYNQQFVYRPFFGISYNLSKRSPLNAIGERGSSYNNSFPTK